MHSESAFVSRRKRANGKDCTRELSRLTREPKPHHWMHSTVRQHHHDEASQQSDLYISPRNMPCLADPIGDEASIALDRFGQFLAKLLDMMFRDRRRQKRGGRPRQGLIAAS